MRVLVTGGGTGGHVVPALVVCERLKADGAEILYVGSRAPLDRQLVEAAGYPFRAITTGKLRRYFSWHNFIDPFRVAAGFLQSWRILRQFKPDVVFGKGGFVTLPVVRAAHLKRIPVVLHESDAAPGLANRLGAKAASKIAVSFPPALMQGLPAEKLVFTGNPLDPGIITGKEERALTKYKLPKGVPVVLVVGGSGGAASLNESVIAALAEILPEAQVVHQVGEAKAAMFQQAKIDLPEELRDRYHVQGFLNTADLADLYAAADIVVTRAGAGLLGNVAATGKPAIMVPLPAKVSPHQLDNARFYAEHGAVLLPQEEASGPELARLVKQLLHNPQKRAEMSRQIRSLANLDAGEKVTALVVEAAGG